MLHTVVPAPRAVLTGVCKLSPASTMTVGMDVSIIKQVYWTLDATRPTEPLSQAQWLAKTREVLVRALDRHRLTADVPWRLLLVPLDGR